MNDSIDRRKFLTGVAALAATSVVGCKSSSQREHTITVGPTTEEAVGLGAEEANAPTMSNGRPALRLLTVEPDGSPLSSERTRTLHARDLHNDPLPQPIVLASGSARVELADEPIQISCRLNVPGFGEVYCYADNNGRGYARAGTIDLVVEAAQTRVRRVRETLERHHGLLPTREFNDHLAAAARPIPKSQGTERVAIAYEALSHGLHAGEQLALAIARDRIARVNPRHDFLFGTAVAGYNDMGPQYQDRIRELFNFGTCTWYTWRGEEFADRDPVDYARMDQSIEWCLKNKIVPKGFGYLYMIRGATPEWIRPIETPSAKAQATSAPAHIAPTTINTMPNSDPSNAPREYNPRWNYDRIKDVYHRIIRTTMARYDGKLPYAEIMNEAHDKANLWGMSHEQVLDMAKMAFAAAREGSKTVKRQMNHCCMWGEYAKTRNADGGRRWSPYRFIKDCFDHGIDYEVIGLQLYYPQNDIFEIDRMLDRFAVFNKKLHITEIATASQDGLDPHSMRPKTYAPGWHGPWSETMQADWVEAIYTLVYSKPSFEAIGWWDLSDRAGHFWPFGGLLDQNLQPKEAYLRLKKLQKDWGVAKA